MADYYPLIAKAVAGLEKNTGEARRSLYERARTALVAQLRGVIPALSESDITRERLALEEAIRKVEAEAARRARYEPPSRPDSNVESKLTQRPPDRPPQAEAVRPPTPENASAISTRRRGAAGDAALRAGAASRRRRRRRAELRRRSVARPAGVRAIFAVRRRLEEVFATSSPRPKTSAKRRRRRARPRARLYAAVPAPSPEFERIEPHVEPEGLRSRLAGRAQPRDRARATSTVSRRRTRDFEAPDPRAAQSAVTRIWAAVAARSHAARGARYRRRPRGGFHRRRFLALPGPHRGPTR